MGSKKTLLVVVIALVAVLALAGVAYATLGERAQSQKSEQTQQALEAASEASQTSANAPESTSSSSTQPAQPDMLTFDFTVESLQGDAVKLSSMMGKPTVLGFWATWCPPCNEEATTAQQLYDVYGDRVNFMMVDATDGERENSEDVRSWLETNGYTYPIYLDTNDLEAIYTFQAVNLPTTVVFDDKGYVVDYSVGAMDEAVMSQMLDGLLA